MKYYLSLIGGFLIHIVIGTVYVTGNISIYIASYLQHKGHNVTLNDVSILLPLQISGTTISILIGSYLTVKISPWLTVIIGNTLVVVSVFATSFITSFIGYILIYSILFGLGVGISYTSPLICSWSHFPKHKATVSGVIVSGFGLGSSIFNLISTKMINPDNKEADYKIDGDKYFNSEISDRLPSTLRWLSLMYLIISIIGISLLTKPKKNLEIDTYLESNRDLECPSIVKGLKTKQFWVVFIMGFFSATPGLYLASAFKIFGKDKINDDQFLTIVGSLSSVFNGSFRFIWGKFMDKTSFKFSYMVLLGLQTVFIVTLYFVASFKVLYLIWICMILCCEGGHFSLFPTIIARMYGKVMGAKLYGIIFYSFSFAALSGFFIQFYMVGVIGYQGVFMIMTGFTIASIVMLFAVFKEINLWEEKKSVTEISSIMNRDKDIDED